MPLTSLGTISSRQFCPSTFLLKSSGYCVGLALINLTREQLKNKLPVKSDTSPIKDSEEAKSLSGELEIIENLKAKLVETVNKIFQTLNDDNIITQMIKVLQKKTTEQAVLNFILIRF